MPRAKLYTEADFPSVKTNVSPSLFISSTKVLSPYSGQPMGYIHQPPLQAILQWAEKNESNLGPGLRASRVLGTAAFDVGSLPLSSENPMQWDFHYHHFIKEEIWQWEERMLNMPVIDTCSVCVCVLNLVIYHKSHNDLAKILRRNGQNEKLKLWLRR